MKEIRIQNEGLDVPVRLWSYDEMHGITMCCVIMNEEEGIRECLEYYKPYVNSIIMIDGGSKDRTVELATPYCDEIIIRTFDGHYSNQANRIIEKAQTDWILLIDYDEKLEKPILERLPQLINQEEYDCYSFPRKNYIDGKYDDKHYPDYQERLFRSYCRRVRPVHGEVVGFKRKLELPCEEGNFMIHSKNGARHNFRNKMYMFYELSHKNELGAPGTQTKESFEAAYKTLHESNFKLTGNSMIVQS